jgi:hypothetical protein
LKQRKQATHNYTHTHKKYNLKAGKDFLNKINKSLNVKCFCREQTERIKKKIPFVKHLIKADEKSLEFLYRELKKKTSKFSAFKKFRID